MTSSRTLVLAAHLLSLWLLPCLAARLQGLAASAGSDAFFYNAALHPGADPYTFYDEASGQYYAYSTTGQDPGWLFAIYTSPDLSTWRKQRGGAMQACIHNGTAFQSGQMCWAKDWQVRPVPHRETSRSAQG